MKIGQRLVLSFSVFIFLLVFIGYIFIIYRHEIVKLYDELTVEIIPKRIALKNINIKCKKMLVETFEFLINRDLDSAAAMKNEENFWKAEKEMEEWEAEYRAAIRNDGAELQFINDVHAKKKEIEKLCKELIGFKKNWQSDIGITSKFSEIDKIEDSLFMLINKAIDYDRKKFEQRHLAIESAFVRLKEAVFIVIGVAVFLAVVLSFFIRISIVVPIRKIRDVMLEVGKGRLDVRIKMKSRDELGFLADSFNGMVDNLQKKTASIEDLNKEISEREKAEEKLENAYEQLKQAQSQLIQSAKMASVGQLAAGVAHEINNPLSGVLNNIQMIKENIGERKDPNLKEIKGTLDEVEESALRCKKAVQDLLDFSHITGLPFKLVSLNKVIESAITLIGGKAQFDNIIIQKQLQLDLPLIPGDYQYLQQAVFNIVFNAKEAIEEKSKKEGGLIIINTQYQREKNAILLSISDNGIGIPKGNLDRIFEPFFTTKPVGKGTGLGLSITYNIIEKHNGSIEVESQVNKGTTFKITLPWTREQGNLG